MKKYIVGIDEVGRGALAGPVVVGAVLLKTGKRFGVSCGLGTIKDSKKLSPKKRALWSLYFKKDPDIECAVARVYPRGIERMNISRAANRAALRAFRRVLMRRGLRDADVLVFLDGGLFLGNGLRPKNAKTVIKGDERIQAISAASIVAKVHRDRYMICLAKQYPAYHFDAHKGYGTKAHYAMLKRFGPCDVHRKTFL